MVPLSVPFFTCSFYLFPFFIFPLMSVFLLSFLHFFLFLCLFSSPLDFIFYPFSSFLPSFLDIFIFLLSFWQDYISFILFIQMSSSKMNVSLLNSVCTQSHLWEEIASAVSWCCGVEHISVVQTKHFLKLQFCKDSFFKRISLLNPAEDKCLWDVI